MTQIVGIALDRQSVKWLYAVTYVASLLIPERSVRGTRDV